MSTEKGIYREGNGESALRSKAALSPRDRFLCILYNAEESLLELKEEAFSSVSMVLSSSSSIFSKPKWVLFWPMAFKGITRTSTSSSSSSSSSYKCVDVMTSTAFSLKLTLRLRPWENPELDPKWGNTAAATVRLGLAEFDLDEAEVWKENEEGLLGSDCALSLPYDSMQLSSVCILVLDSFSVSLWFRPRMEGFLGKTRWMYLREESPNVMTSRSLNNMGE